MPRVHHVKKARKNNPAVKRGESYFWWKFRYGGKRYSATRPRPSQLTQSAYFGTLRGMVEAIEDYEVSDKDDLETLKDDIITQLSDLCSETQDSLDNMPDSLQYSPTRFSRFSSCFCIHLYSCRIRKQEHQYSPF